MPQLIRIFAQYIKHMKILTIGDLHGRKVLDQIKLKIDKSDLAIFLGDYVDPYPMEDNIYTGKDLLKYLNNIIQIKRDNPDKVILLLGNHDVHYFYNDEYCTRYDYSLRPFLSKIYLSNLHLFQVAHQIDNNLWTHAGVTKKWLKKYESIFKEYGLKKDYSNLADILNELLYTEHRDILWEISPYRGASWDNVGGPLWADAQESCLSVLPNMKQFVGHTSLIKKEHVKRNNGDGEGEVTYCDILSETVDKNGKRIINTDCHTMELE